MKFEEHTGEIRNAYEEIPRMDKAALSAWLVGVALSISDELKNARNSSLRYLISEAKNIVRDRYGDAGLSLDTVCSGLGVSNSYFSSVFKKEAGIPFITYLTDYRMQQAVRLILETNEKSYNKYNINISIFIFNRRARRNNNRNSSIKIFIIRLVMVSSKSK